MELVQMEAVFNTFTSREKLLLLCPTSVFLAVVGDVRVLEFSFSYIPSLNHIYSQV
jgi:hypothetical protein